mgnify:CR=1 FL=1
MKLKGALKKVKKGKIVKFPGGWLEPYDDYLFIKAIVDYRGRITKIFDSYSFYSEHGFKEVKR